MLPKVHQTIHHIDPKGTPLKPVVLIILTRFPTTTCSWGWEKVQLRKVFYLSKCWVRIFTVLLDCTHQFRELQRLRVHAFTIFNNKSVHLVLPYFKPVKIETPTSFESSDDHVFMVTMRSRGTQWLYTAHKLAMASSPSLVCSPPIRTRSGANKSLMAVPSARNSGLDRTWNRAI